MNWQRILFFGFCYTVTALGLIGLMAIYYLFGKGAFFAAAIAIVLFALWREGRRPIYFDAGEVFRIGGATPPPGKPALPPPGMRAITDNRSHTRR
jgi:hypothetical protein